MRLRAAGATRGLGLALVDDIATKDQSAVIYAGARNTSNGAAQLIQVAAKYPGRVHVEGNDALAKQIAAEHGRLDTVIANAGAIPISLCSPSALPADKFTDEFSVNALGPIVLFQSTRELLKASPLPRFVPISSAGGSMEFIPQMGAMDASPYGASKAALNWVTRKIHFENEWLTSKLVDIIVASTREKDGGQFHNSDDGRHPW
ncbi:NAD(P)-binding protein [Pholiota molesta]|nr:NAD(P)-binding protein [Pholiota molesta]